MKKFEVVQTLLHCTANHSIKQVGQAFASTNIALCKYWGKRDTELNLPLTSSLSVALPNKGAWTSIQLHEKKHDEVILNDAVLPEDSQFVKRVQTFLDLFRPQLRSYIQLNIKMNLPVAAGLASSACGFAALTLALNDLCDWQLSLPELSILARLGSGSAARSLWYGFVEWRAGACTDGMDSYAEPLAATWPALCVGILTMSHAQKPISSRIAMQRTVETSVLYQQWPQQVARDLALIKEAIATYDFELLGRTAENNALSMHATMLSSWPPICYALPETVAAMQQVWQLRAAGIPVYFTQDAGPNLKLLFLEKDQQVILEHFPAVEIIKCF